jgi:hypothetical protein
MHHLKECFFILAVALSGCGPIPLGEKGNVGCLVDIETNMRSKVIRSYVDTLRAEDKLLQVPVKWQARATFNYDHLDDTVVYFKEPPEEMYMLTFASGPCIRYIYNEKIKQDDWLSDEDTLAPGERKRIQDRFSKEVLAAIEARALAGGLPKDSLYFFLD